MVKRTFLGTSILGRGNYTGFRIWDSRYNLIVKTKDYKMFPIATVVAISIMFLSPIFFAYFFGSGSIIKSILVFCFSSFVVVCVMPWICRNIIYGKNYKHGLEWHAAEHYDMWSFRINRRSKENNASEPKKDPNVFFRLRQ